MRMQSIGWEKPLMHMQACEVRVGLIASGKTARTCTLYGIWIQTRDYRSAHVSTHGHMG